VLNVKGERVTKEKEKQGKKKKKRKNLPCVPVYCSMTYGV
jgi:hypothetical protein